MQAAKCLRDGVRTAYSAAADRPSGKHPFPVGRTFAQNLGYDPNSIDSLPTAAVDAFAGVSNVAEVADLPPGARVLDLGCGAGLDSLIAARRVGSSGRVTGVDFSEAMLGRARSAAEQTDFANVEFILADAEHLPLPDASIDVALINGIFNLNPAREDIFRELARVVRPGGQVFAAELILREPLPSVAPVSEDAWFS